MTTVYRWTGREAKLLRHALQLSIRDFAAHLGVGARTVNKWEAGQENITPLPYMQEVLDTALAQASNEAQARFTAATRADAPEHQATQRSGSPVRGAMLPVVIDGRLTLVSFDANVLVTGGLGGVLAELANISAAGASALAASERIQTSDLIAAASSDLWQMLTAEPFGEAPADLDLDRLDRLIPHLDTDELPREVGAADVDAIEHQRRLAAL